MVYIPVNRNVPAAPAPRTFPVPRRLPPIDPEESKSSGVETALPDRRLGCAGGSGSAVSVTGCVGFFVAAYVVDQLVAWGTEELNESK